MRKVIDSRRRCEPFEGMKNAGLPPNGKTAPQQLNSFCLGLDFILDNDQPQSEDDIYIIFSTNLVH